MEDIKKYTKKVVANASSIPLILDEGKIYRAVDDIGGAGAGNEPGILVKVTEKTNIENTKPEKFNYTFTKYDGKENKESINLIQDQVTFYRKSNFFGFGGSKKSRKSRKSKKSRKSRKYYVKG